MTTPALRSARRALPILALFTALAAAMPAGASAATLLHDYPAELHISESVFPAADDVAGSVHGTNNGAYTLVGGGHNSSYAFDFNGTNQEVRLPDDSSFYPAGSFTVEAWVKTSQTTGIQQVVTMDECAGSSRDTSLEATLRDGCKANARSTWQLSVKDGRAAAFLRDADGGSATAQGREGQALAAPLGGRIVADGAWHQLTFTRDMDAGRLTLYQDGIVVNEQGFGPGVSGPLLNDDNETDELSIGSRLEGAVAPASQYNPVEEFNGQVDDVRFYNGAVSPDTTPPVISGAILGDAVGDWYTSDQVTVRWTGAALGDLDPQSFIRTTVGCGDTVITEDTAGQVVTCTATSAGGTTTQSLTVKHDATPPTVTCDQVSPRYPLKSAAKMTATAVDAMSGVTAKGNKLSGSIESDTIGAHAITFNATDNVNNFGSVSCPYTIYKAVTHRTTLAKLAKAPSPKGCIRKRRLSLKLKKLSGTNTIAKAEFDIGTKLVKSVTGASLKKTITLTKLPKKGRYRLTVTLTDAKGDFHIASRIYRPC